MMPTWTRNKNKEESKDIEQEYKAAALLRERLSEMLEAEVNKSIDLMRKAVHKDVYNLAEFYIEELAKQKILLEIKSWIKQMAYPDLQPSTIDLSGHTPGADGALRGFDPSGSFVPSWITDLSVTAIDYQTLRFTMTVSDLRAIYPEYNDGNGWTNNSFGASTPSSTGQFTIDMPISNAPGDTSYQVRVYEDGTTTVSNIVSTTTPSAPAQGPGWNREITFEGLAVGSDVDSGPTGVDGVPNTNYGNTEVTDIRAASGTKSARVEFDQGTFAENGSGLIIDFGDADNFAQSSDVYDGGHVWYQLQTFFPTGFDFTATGFNLKFMRIGTRRGNGSNGGYLDIYIKNNREVYYQNEVADASQDDVDDTKRINTNEWQTWTVHAVLSRTTPLFELWRGTEKLLTNNTFVTLPDNAGYAERAMFVTYWNGGVPQNQEAFVDNIKVSNQVTPTWATSLDGVS